MRNSVKENISEHSLEVAMIAHALGIIANEKFGKEIDLGKITLMGLYHDANEIITGDMPTPVTVSYTHLMSNENWPPEQVRAHMLAVVPQLKHWN